MQRIWLLNETWYYLCNWLSQLKLGHTSYDVRLHIVGVQEAQIAARATYKKYKGRIMAQDIQRLLKKLL